jgi:hypothetical protein
VLEIIEPTTTYFTPFVGTGEYPGSSALRWAYI